MRPCQDEGHPQPEVGHPKAGGGRLGGQVGHGGDGQFLQPLRRGAGHGQVGAADHPRGGCPETAPVGSHRHIQRQGFDAGHVPRREAGVPAMVSRRVLLQVQQDALRRRALRQACRRLHNLQTHLQAQTLRKWGELRIIIFSVHVYLVR